MIPPVALLALATANPPHQLEQDHIAETAKALFAARYPQFERLLPVFENTGIRRRQSVEPMSWFLTPKDWPQRGASYLAGADALYAEAATRALDEAGLTGADIDVLVTVSSTGIATPTLEARAMTRLGFRSDVVRTPVFGLGCAGGVSGLALAARLAAAEPGRTVLFVTLELCTLSFQLDGGSTADVVATALFGDGAAACVLRAGGGDGFATVRSGAEHTWPDTLDIMGWRVDPAGLGVIFAQSIPLFAHRRLKPAMSQMLRQQGVDWASVDRFVCHPGGTKVLEALETSLGLGPGALDLEREVLADHGNMSAPTVLFVLDALRRRGLPPRSVLAALGPGFTASTVTLDAA